MSLRVVLCDDHELIRGGLRRAFEDTGEFTVTTECGTAAACVAAVRADQPDVLVIDIGLPDRDGLDAVRDIRGEQPTLGIVVLTMYTDDAHLFGALDAGASAFVPKSDPSDKVIAAARHAVSAPGSFIANELAAAFQRRMQPSGVQLTERELEVLRLVAAGLTTSALARKLFMSESTAKGHLARLYDKLDATNRTQAVMNAVRLGLLSSEDAQDGSSQL
jgi:DNA-binding NarL/FixJ family response regulator